ncbi:hypothetical protein HDV05_000751 [Chytridiales sp. JEL 0842]|nr:hypothetical protein HDV05_000751 [Chytridiales sp. JEL 0842]
MHQQNSFNQDPSIWNLSSLNQSHRQQTQLPPNQVSTKPQRHSDPDVHPYNEVNSSLRQAHDERQQLRRRLSVPSLGSHASLDTVLQGSQEDVMMQMEEAAVESRYASVNALLYQVTAERGRVLD